jgi:hypothetical protein
MLKSLLTGSQPTDPCDIRSYTFRVIRVRTTRKAHADLQLHRADISFVDRLVSVTGDAVAISPNPVRSSQHLLALVVRGNVRSTVILEILRHPNVRTTWKFDGVLTF